jgi:hypothetical protein
MSEDNHPKNNPEKNQQESIEEFCKRVGLKYIKGEKGGMEFSPCHGGNLLHKRPKKTSKA